MDNEELNKTQIAMARLEEKFKWFTEAFKAHDNNQEQQFLSMKRKQEEKFDEMLLHLEKISKNKANKWVEYGFIVMLLLILVLLLGARFWDLVNLLKIVL